MLYRRFTYAIAPEAGIPISGMFRTDLSLEFISTILCVIIFILTETEQTTQKKANGQQSKAYEELAALSDGWYEGVANGTLPDLVQ